MKSATMPRRLIATTCMLFASLFATTPSLWSQTVVPFDTTGFIQSATIDNPGVTLSAGFITVNNHKIRVPANAFIQLPANTLGWGQIFAFAPGTYGTNASTGQAQTGLALSDSPRLPGSYEAHVQGNIVGGQYIAGLIFLSQQAANVAQGVISSIDYDNAELRVNGTRVQINDPAAKFSVGLSPDIRFTIDEENPTIRATTGYPMCLPRVAPTTATPAGTQDPLCPEKNRPLDPATGAHLRTIDPMDAPGVSVSRFANQAPTDPNLMAPFEVGDFVSYQGEIQNDGRGTYITAHTIIANVGLYTAPGTNPAYVGIDVLLQGTGALPLGLPQEATSKVKVEGFSTDPSRNVDIYAFDPDCAGNFVDRVQRPWVLNFPVDPGPPTGAIKGRFRFLPAGGAFLPPAQSVHVIISGQPLDGTGHPTLPARNATQLIPNQYFAPEFDFIFPENRIVGDPPPLNNFTDFLFLVNGVGSAPGNGGVSGQLDPFPDLAQNVPARAGSDPFTGVACPAPQGGSVTPIGGGGDGGGTGTVNAVLLAPAASFTNQPIFLDASFSIPSTGPFAWSINPDPGGINFTSAAQQFITISQPDTYTISVTVGPLSSGGPSSNTTRTVVVSNVLVPPKVSVFASPTAVASGAAVALTSSINDANNSPISSFTWTDGGAGGTFSNPNAASTSYKLTNTSGAPKTVTLTLTATDAAGQTGVGSTSVTVNPVAPPDVVSGVTVTYVRLRARLTITANDSAAAAGQNVTMIASYLDDFTNPSAPRTVSLVMTNLGGGAFSSGTLVSAAIPTAELGTFTVKVTSSAGGVATSLITTLK